MPTVPGFVKLFFYPSPFWLKTQSTSSDADSWRRLRLLLLRRLSHAMWTETVDELERRRTATRLRLERAGLTTPPGAEELRRQIADAPRLVAEAAVVANRAVMSAATSGMGGPYAGKGGKLTPTPPMVPPPSLHSKGDGKDGKGKGDKSLGDKGDNGGKGSSKGDEGDTPINEDTEQQHPQQQALNKQMIQKMKQQEHRIERLEEQVAEQGRQLRWTLSMLDRALPLPADAKPSHH